MATIRLKHVIADVDRHGNTRHYVRIKGRPKVRLPGQPGTKEFMAAYHAALEMPAIDHAPGTDSFFQLVLKYRQSSFFQSLDARSQRVRAGILARFCAEHGAKPYKLMEPRHIRMFRDDLFEKPGSATNLMKALRHVFKFAVKSDLVKDDPAAKVEYLRKKNGGFHTWTVEEVLQFDARHPTGTKARLAKDMLLYLGQRRSDIVKLGRQHEKQGALKFRQTKPPHAELELPILPALRVSIAATPATGLTYLETHRGLPYTANGFGNAFREWCDQAGLPQCSSHGLRKAGATFCAENGATEEQLKAIFGWRTLSQAALYTRAARQANIARASMHLIVPPDASVVSHPRKDKG